MKRRFFLGGMVSFLIVPPALAVSRWGEGELSGRDFFWTNGGGDPYRGTLDHALQLGGITEARVRSALVQMVEIHPRGNAERYTIVDGDRLGVMVSGQNGWVARHTVAMPSRWRSGRSRQASVWYWRDRQTGVQYRLMKADVCGNWLFDFYGAPELCRCIRGVDAC